MTAFADHVEFADRIGLTLTEAEQDRADELLARASDVIRDAAGSAGKPQTISLVEDDELTRPGTRDELILLPQRPVVSVASVALDGSEISGWYLDGNEIVRAAHRYMVGLPGRPGGEFGGFGSPYRTLTIVYTHGYADVDLPGRVKEICGEMVARVWFNPGSLIQQTVAGTETTYAPFADPPRGLMLTDSETKEIRRIFTRPAISVSVE